MRVITAPNIYTQQLRDYPVFMAGGITGCDNWQKYVIEKLDNFKSNVVLLNPRRANFDTTDPTYAEEQIKWEFHYLKVAKTVMFWFPEGGLCSITLFELGWILGLGKKFEVGCHPKYVRAFDVNIQVRLRHPRKKIYDNLEELYGIDK